MSKKQYKSTTGGGAVNLTLDRNTAMQLLSMLHGALGVGGYKKEPKLPGGKLPKA